MAGPRASDILGHVTLVTGRRSSSTSAPSRRRAAVRRPTPSRRSPRPRLDSELAALGDLAAPSLFSSIRCVVVRGLEDLPEEAHDGLVAYAAAPVEDIGLVLVHSGGQKGSGLLTKLRKIATVTEVKSAALKPSEYSRFVAAEVRGAGGRIAEDAADCWCRRSARTCGRWRVPPPARQRLPRRAAHRVGREQYFGGRAEVKSFAIADAAFCGPPPTALEELRWALDNGHPAGAGHQRVRGPACGVGPLPGRAARAAGGRPGPGGGGAAVEDPDGARAGPRLGRAGDRPGDPRVAQADADVKGAAGDAAYALERMVLTVTGLARPPGHDKGALRRSGSFGPALLSVSGVRGTRRAC